MTETKHEKFERLITSRLQNITNILRTIKNLSKPNYEYTQTDVDWMREKLYTAADETLAEFSKPKKGK